MRHHAQASSISFLKKNMIDLSTIMDIVMRLHAQSSSRSIVKKNMIDLPTIMDELRENLKKLPKS